MQGEFVALAKSTNKSKSTTSPSREKKSKRNRRKGPSRPPNTRGAEAVTVAWMLSILITVLSQMVSIVTALIIKLSASQWPLTFQMLPGLMLAISMMTGVVTIFLTYLTHRLRRDRPPSAITTFAIAVGVIPLTTMIILGVMGG